jgi:AbiJ N-terminal domain 3
MKAFPEQDAAPGRITEVTRRRLLDGVGWLRDSVPTGFREFMEPGQTFWSGALNEIEFLNRLYDLGELPSHDRRYTTAFQDIFRTGS